MIRKPLIQRSNRGLQSSEPDSVPAPIGGWNARDPIAAMPETDASWLENWQPGTADVSTRKGCDEWSSGMSGAVQAIMPYNDEAAARKLFAATPAGIYDITAAGPVGAIELACLSGKFNYVNFATIANPFIVAVNGVDDLALYNGGTGTWSFINAVSTPIAITGLATNLLDNVSIFKRRLVFVEKDSMSLWYLPVNAVGGALTEFPVGALFSLGGKVIATANWSVDGGDGLDDFLVIITDQGEVAIYRGIDIADANNFALVGVFFLGEPVGKKPFVKMGGDLVVLTRSGLYPLSKALLSTTVNRSSAISRKIDSAFNSQAALYGNTYGWQGMVNTTDNLLVVNSPVTEGTFSRQFVMHTITGAWALYTGWNAGCFEKFNGQYFFGGLGKVVRCFSGFADFGAAIQCNVRQAFTNFGRPRYKKEVKLIRPIFTGNGAFGYNLGLDYDYSDTDILAPNSFGTSSSSKWDQAQWNQAQWAPDYTVSKPWEKAAVMPAYTFALRLRLAAKGVNVRWNATDYIIQRAGIL